ncbi:MAG: histidine phosphatase family protein [Halioglobus sp.]
MSEVSIYLVRHGEAAASWGESPDPGLSELGWEQAEDAGKTLLKQLQGPVNLVSSPLARAIETAQPLARALELDVAISPSFTEIPSPVPLSERQNWLRGFMGERWQQQPEFLQKWRQQALGELTALTQDTVIFTHFLVLNAVVGSILGKEETMCFRPGNASITQLALRDGALELVSAGQEMSSVIN